MKNLLFALLLVCGVGAVNAQTIEVSGKVKGSTCEKGGLTIFSTEEREDQFQQFDMESGAFEFKTTSDYPVVIRIGTQDRSVMKMVGRGYIPSKTSTLWVVATPNKPLKVKCEIKDGYVVPAKAKDKENKAFASINNAYFAKLSAALDISVELALKDKELSEAEKSELKARGDKLSAEAFEMQKAAVTKNASSIAGLYYIDDMLLRSQIEPSEVEKLLATVGAEYHSHPYYKKLVAKVEGAKSAALGAKAPNIVSTQTADGSKFDMRTLRGKVILLDFWGTWCGPCMADMPKVKALKDKYGDKLEVVTVAKDKRAAWLNEINKGNMPFHNLLNGAGEEDYVSKFNVQGFPTKLIIDQRGNIVYRNKQSKESFEEVLEKLIK